MKLRLIVGGRTRRRLPSRTWRQAFIERYGFRVVQDHDGHRPDCASVTKLLTSNPPQRPACTCGRTTEDGETAPTVEKHFGG